MREDLFEGFNLVAAGMARTQLAGNWVDVLYVPTPSYHSW